MRICQLCDELHDKGQRCPTATRAREQQRPSAADRGYDSAWKKLSTFVIDRDGERCQIRLHCCTGKATTADHIIPKAHGGTDDPSNLQAACRECNSAKRDRNTG